MAGGGHIIIRRLMVPVAQSGAVQDQLGPKKRDKLIDIIAADAAEWTPAEAKFVWKCVNDAQEAYE